MDFCVKLAKEEAVTVLPGKPLKGKKYFTYNIVSDYLINNSNNCTTITIIRRVWRENGIKENNQNQC